jgi:LPXTG-motif cell wall-anchored protein
MIKKALWIGLTLSVLGLLPVTPASADEWNKKTVLTFSQPFEIPGHVLPAGTYTFKLADTLSDRHIVQIFNADGSTLIATVMTIPDYRLKTTTETVIRFNEVPLGAPEAIRAWFYPGNSVGQEFVYPKERASQLARLANTPVPAIAVSDATDLDTLKSARIVAVTPDAQEVAVTAAIQTRPLGGSTAVPGTIGVEQTDQTSRASLPQTASNMPLLVLVGVVAIGLGTLLLMFRKAAVVPAKAR